MADPMLKFGGGHTFLGGFTAVNPDADIRQRYMGRYEHLNVLKYIASYPVFSQTNPTAKAHRPKIVIM